MGEGQGSPKAEMKHTPGEEVPHPKDEAQQDSEMSSAPKWHIVGIQKDVMSNASAAMKTNFPF